jgi:hypothetical protein
MVWALCPFCVQIEKGISMNPLILKELESKMQCNCDLDNWQPEPSTGHSSVCRIHKKAMSLQEHEIKLNPPAAEAYDWEADAARERIRLKEEKLKEERERDAFKCHCNYQLGMGPNLQCPLHGPRQHLHYGAVNARQEIARLKEKATDRKWEVKRLKKLLEQISEISDSRVIKSMIKLGLDTKRQDACTCQFSEEHYKVGCPIHDPALRPETNGAI